jgi:hypothetical protein
MRCWLLLVLQLWRLEGGLKAMCTSSSTLQTQWFPLLGLRMLLLLLPRLLRLLLLWHLGSCPRLVRRQLLGRLGTCLYFDHATQINCKMPHLIDSHRHCDLRVRTVDLRRAQHQIFQVLLVAFELFKQPPHLILPHLILLASIVGKLRTAAHAHPLLRLQYPSG